MRLLKKQSGRPPVFQRAGLGSARGGNGPTLHAAWTSTTSDHASLLHQTGDDPALGLGDRTRLGDLDHVAHLVLALLVVRVVLARRSEERRVGKECRCRWV